MFVSTQEFLLTLQNDSDVYRTFLATCQRRFFGEKWGFSDCIFIVKLSFIKLSDNGRVAYERGAIDAAKQYLDDRYYSHFITEILPDYYKNAQISLESWQKAQESL